MATRLIDGKKIAADIRGEVSEATSEFTGNTGIVPGLAVVLVGDDPASSVYVRNKHRAATEAGMLVEDITFPNSVGQDELLSHIKRLNSDKRIHGILLQLPVPPHIDQHEIIAVLDPEKDVDGLHPVNIGLLVAGKQRFVPATPAGIQQLLLRSSFETEGKHVVVCGRSDIVGKPVSVLMALRQPGANATVTMCHTMTKDLASITRQADILIAAIGRPLFIKPEMVKEGVVVIDVGINRIESSKSKRGYRLVGDVDFDSVAGKSAGITPVPGGVGPMTIAMLLHNTFKAAQLSVSEKT